MLKKNSTFKSKTDFLSCLCIVLFTLVLCTSCDRRRYPGIDGLKDADEVVRISSLSDPSTLDPRKARDLPTATVLHMLYEGLMQMNPVGKVIPAIAQDYTLSEDKKVYTFHLKKSFWSNGEPLTAYDFERTWLSVLEPDFPAPNAYQFYVIKNAREAKEGKVPLSEVGIKALDDKRLQVELTAPTPYFIDLLAAHFFYPYNPKSTPTDLISNGPFKLHSWKKQNQLVALKNPHFWEQHDVRLDGIVVVVVDEQTALKLFEKKELDWIGSPMSTLPQDAMATLKRRKQLKVAPAAGTHWFIFNTEKPPFSNIKMRRAFAWALNRKAIVEHVTQGNQRPAELIVPPELGLQMRGLFPDNDTAVAWNAFQEGLDELNISRDDLGPIKLCYSFNDRNHKIAQAVQQQWAKAFGVDVRLENCESNVFYDKASQGEFNIASNSWFADFRDPVNFLDVFKSKSNRTNNTRWENQEYMALLDQSALEDDPDARMSTLKRAQSVLIYDMPVAPLFFAAFNYVKDDRLIGVYFSDLGFVDFRYAFYQ